eukprot:CAMPEP_0204518510 /NCGR_PEP_ID=MMETSP0661-20131031/4238_1 /ASSEMBLY_ACC=CAM_ASM_000606 /TAXON_ID=109239 /ORGANISM="Alexandrium margalefi, Strain AMGDE01CS-322" /LENGTH=153 /DNA_ID=CAMNT_0051523959 /DNA_START=252 /DNA_END=714 /DNA_ORIENTATION=+
MLPLLLVRRAAARNRQCPSLFPEQQLEPGWLLQRLHHGASVLLTGLSTSFSGDDDVAFSVWAFVYALESHSATQATTLGKGGRYCTHLTDQALRGREHRLDCWPLGVWAYWRLAVWAFSGLGVLKPRETSRAFRAHQLLLTMTAHCTAGSWPR